MSMIYPVTQSRAEKVLAQIAVVFALVALAFSFDGITGSFRDATTISAWSEAGDGTTDLVGSRILFPCLAADDHLTNVSLFINPVTDSQVGRIGANRLTAIDRDEVSSIPQVYDYYVYGALAYWLLFLAVAGIPIFWDAFSTNYMDRFGKRFIFFNTWVWPTISVLVLIAATAFAWLGYSLVTPGSINSDREECAFENGDDLYLHRADGSPINICDEPITDKCEDIFESFRTSTIATGINAGVALVLYVISLIVGLVSGKEKFLQNRVYLKLSDMNKPQ